MHDFVLIQVIGKYSPLESTDKNLVRRFMIEQFVDLSSGSQLVAGTEGEGVVGQLSIMYADVGPDEEVGRINLCDVVIRSPITF